MTRERVFFCGMSIAIAAVIFIGFARTYFLAAAFHAPPLAAPIVHVHAAVFTGWILLLVLQTGLTAGGRTDLHRRLGVLGAALAAAVLVLGVAVAIEMVTRFAGRPAADAPGIFAVALSEIAGFAGAVSAALLLRRRPAFHKRLILIGTIAMTTAGFGRWPVASLLHRPLPAMLAAFTLLLALAAYDLLSLRRLHRATLVGSAWVIGVELLSLPIGHTAAWRAFAAYVQSHAR